MSGRTSGQASPGVYTQDAVASNGSYALLLDLAADLQGLLDLQLFRRLAAVVGIAQLSAAAPAVVDAAESWVQELKLARQALLADSAVATLGQQKLAGRRAAREILQRGAALRAARRHAGSSAAASLLSLSLSLSLTHTARYCAGASSYCSGA